MARTGWLSRCSWRCDYFLSVLSLLQMFPLVLEQDRETFRSTEFSCQGIFLLIMVDSVVAVGLLFFHQAMFRRFTLIRQMLIVIGMFIVKLFVGVTLSTSIAFSNQIHCFVAKEGALAHAGLIGLVQLRFLHLFLCALSDATRACIAAKLRRGVRKRRMEGLIKARARTYCTCRSGRHGGDWAEGTAAHEALLHVASPAAEDNITCNNAKNRHDGNTFCNEGSCSICIEDFLDGAHVLQLSSCGHVFHVPCITPWLRGHNSCPNCRRVAVARGV